MFQNFENTGYQAVTRRNGIQDVEPYVKDVFFAGLSGTGPLQEFKQYGVEPGFTGDRFMS